MRVALECSVDARIRLPQDIDEPWFRNKQLIIRRNAEGYISTIRIEGRAEQDDIPANTVEIAANGMMHFTASGGLRIHTELEGELQLVESTLGLFCKLSRVRWEHATTILIPETEEEERLIKFNNLSMSRTPPDDSCDPGLADFYAFLQIGNCARDIVQTLAFYREGCMDLNGGRFITAFFSFYFVIEGLYSNGKWRQNEVKVEYLKSNVLRESIGTALAMPLFQKPRTNLIYSLEDFLRMANRVVAEYVAKDPKKARAPLTRNIDDVIEMITWVRGELHHFGGQVSVARSPFAHQRYEMLANFMHDVCLGVLGKETLARVPRNTDESQGARHDKST